VSEHAPVIVVRTPNWLGDTVMALPALAALRAARGEARIVAIGRWAPLLSGQGVADALLPYPRRPLERLVLGRAVRGDRPDLAVLLVNSLEAALAAWWWRAERRLGFDTDGRRALLTVAPPAPSPRRHQIDEYALLLSAVDVPVDRAAAPSWRLPTSAVEDEEVDGLLAQAGLSASAPIIGLHLGAAFGPSKLWAVERWGRLATRLAGAGLSPVLLGAGGDHEAALAVSRASDRAPSSLVGRDRPALLPRLLSRLACLVSGDTGVAHLAAALGVPTVTLFGPTDPRLSAPRSGRARVVYRDVACSPCFLTACPIDHVCLGGITPQEVEAQVWEAMAA
jgi:heptosyltransferase-2